MKNRIRRVFTWDEFKELLIELYPSEVYYAQGHAPLSRPPVELRLVFQTKDAQYIFIDTGKGDTLRRTGIPVTTDKYGNFVLEEKDIKKFIYTELKRNDIKIRSFELMGGY